jgi:hypothetical protein
MRFKEIFSLKEGLDLAEFIEDDADQEADAALLNTLREIQFSSDHAQIPKISAEALINLVKTKPGGESFNLESLMSARKNNEAVKNIVGNIQDNDQGIKYVFIRPADDTENATFGQDGEQIKTAPEKTVASMAKSALAKRT